MKRVLALTLVLVTALSFVACTNNVVTYVPNTPASSVPTSSRPSILKEVYPDFDPTPIAITSDEILSKAIAYIQDKKPDKSKHVVDSYDVVNYNWFEDTFILNSKADRDLFDALGHGGQYMSVTIVRQTYEYQNKIAYEITLAYQIPCADSAQLLAYMKDDLHRFPAFREITQKQVSYILAKQGTSNSETVEQLLDEDYQQLLTSDKFYIRTKDNSKKSERVRFNVKAADGNYCIDITIKT